MAPSTLPSVAPWGLVPTDPSTAWPHVGVRTNIIEVLSVDDMAERFTAVFTIHFEWVDPLLGDFWGQVVYLPAPESGIPGIQRRRAKVVFPTNEENSTNEVVLKLEELENDLLRVPLDCFIGKEEPNWDGDMLLFRPKWSFENRVGEVIELLHERTLKYVSDQGGHVFEKCKFQATFREVLKLQRFPYDQQDLAIRLTAECTSMRWFALPHEVGKTNVPALWSVRQPQQLNIYHPQPHQT